MEIIEVALSEIEFVPELARSGSSKQFEERLKASIAQVGLAEPIKVAPSGSGKYLLIDGALRVRAMRAIRAENPDRFSKIAAYLLDYDLRYEIRYQSDIYQDLLPSQLAVLVEHLHRSEHVLKADIARYIGVSSATLRNYTGLWRLMERGGLFAEIVELMDADVLPSSNPYAWLRLTDEGLLIALEQSFSNKSTPVEWVVGCLRAVRLGEGPKYSLAHVEKSTTGLPPHCYRNGEDVRAVKRNLGLRRVATGSVRASEEALKVANIRLNHVVQHSPDVLLASAAASLIKYLG